MTDKELTVEIVKVIAAGWSAKNIPVRGDDLVSLITVVYDTISNLHSEKEQKVSY